MLFYNSELSYSNIFNNSLLNGGSLLYTNTNFLFNNCNFFNNNSPYLSQTNVIFSNCRFDCSQINGPTYIYNNLFNLININLISLNLYKNCYNIENTFSNYKIHYIHFTLLFLII